MTFKLFLCLIELNFSSFLLKYILEHTKNKFFVKSSYVPILSYFLPVLKAHNEYIHSKNSRK